MNKARFILTLLLVTCLLSGCRRDNPLEEEQSAFGVYVERLDSTQLLQYFRQMVAEDSSKWRAYRVVRERYDSCIATQNPTIWFTRMGLSEDADSLVAILRRELPLMGLDTTAFHLPEIVRDLTIVRQLVFDSLGISINEVLPRLDYNLSQAYVFYTTGQRYGFMRPSKVFNRLDLKPDTKTKEYRRLFDYKVEDPQYQEALSKLTSNERMPYLRASQPVNTEIFTALRQQMTKSIDDAERRRLAVNMERCRWQMAIPKQQQPVILVNIAAQHLWAISKDSVLDMRICCGSTTNKTPLLHSEISYMQVNPDWIVPQNIVKADFMRHAGDSAYFARNQYYIVERASGDTLDPRYVTAHEMEKGHLRIGQKSGEGNSLGRIVFRFANDFGVYLHDTNNHAAFKRDRRTLSHGCIRVEKPFELACFLLPSVDEWTLDRLRLSMDISPESERGKKYLKEHKEDPRPLRLLTYHDVSPRVPLFFLYFTSFPNPATGQLDTFTDVYGYDKVIATELSHLLAY